MQGAIRQVVVAALVAVVAPSATVFAGPLGTTGSFTLTRVEQLREGAGGEFTVYGVKTLAGAPSDGLSNAAYSDNPATRNVPNPFPGGAAIPASFQTFCLEMTEDALLGANTSNYFVVGTFAAAGGGGAVNGRDPISKGTAWLYSQFAQGLLNVPVNPTNLAGNYFSEPASPPRYKEAGFLQKAIWWLEQESDPTSTNRLANPYYQAALAMFGGEAGAQTTALEGEYGVYVLNNFKSETALQTFLADGKSMANVPRAQRGQDFLYYAPVAVPDGGTTAMLLGGALVLLGVLRRTGSL